MTTKIDKTILRNVKLCTPSFQGSNNLSEIILGGRSDKNVNVVYIASDFINTDLHRKQSRRKDSKHIPQTMSNKYSLSKFGNEYQVECEGENTMCLTFKIVVGHENYDLLNDLHFRATKAVKEMLSDRSKSSSKYYKNLPCVISKSLIAKYQKNKKCKSVKNVVLPISGDKGRQIKIEVNGFRIPSIFKKEVIPFDFKTPIVGYIRSCEFFKKKGKWYLSISYNTPRKKIYKFKNVLGVDRNSRGNILTASNLETGQVLKLGIDTGGYQYNWRRRRKHLQSKGKLQLCKKLSGSQAKRIKDENHKVSRTLVDYAYKHRLAIVLENLSGIRKGKARKYTEKSQWSYFQLQTFICYKAALLGVPVFYVNPAYTSKKCSRCGHINQPNGKKFNCIKCDHFDHRDANAGFNIGQRFFESSFGSSAIEVRCIGNPQTIQCDFKILKYA